ncbi:MAG: autotransporter outer membrane beta-barrel domain-containing protein [Alphaproteobacteria bacterium]
MKFINTFGAMAIALPVLALAGTSSWAATNKTTGTSNSDTTQAATTATTKNTVQTTQTGVTGTVAQFVTATGGTFPSGGDTGGGPGETSQIEYRFDRKDGFKTLTRGAAAGGVDGKLAVWLNAGYSKFEEDSVAIEADGDTYSVSAGADWLFTDRLIGGLSVSGEFTETTLTFNDGSLDSEGLTVAPYFVAILGKNRNLLLDVVAGYGMTENDATRANGAITGNYDSSKYFVASNLTYLLRHSNFAIAPKAGLLWFESSNDGYTESGTGGVDVPAGDSQLGQVNFGGRIDYVKNPKFIPYLSIQGEYDFVGADYSALDAATRPPEDDVGATLGAGASVQLSERATGTLAGTTALARENFSAYSLSATLRLRF